MIDDASSAERINREAYDRMARQGHVLATPVKQEELLKPLEVVDGRGWLGGDIRGWKVLCLAAGGGRHSALYSAAGAVVTVVDISAAMLELDRTICNRFKFDVRMIQASMVSLPMLHNGEFDLVIHPVSSCYIPKLQNMFTEISRVLRPGGLYISQHKNPINLQSSLHSERGRYWIESEVEARARPVSPGESSPLREPNAREFAHSLESILGGICRAGMTIEDFSEPEHAKADSPLDSVGHRARFIPPYIRIKARRNANPSRQGSSLILPK